MQYARCVWIDTRDVIHTKGLFFIPLYALQAPLSLQDTWNVMAEMRGILVEHVYGTAGTAGTFRRCGHVFLSATIDEETRAFEPAWEAIKLSAGKEEFPCEECDSVSGHLVTIIYDFLAPAHQGSTIYLNSLVCREKQLEACHVNDAPSRFKAQSARVPGFPPSSFSHSQPPVSFDIVEITYPLFIPAIQAFFSSLSITIQFDLIPQVFPLSLMKLECSNIFMI